MKTYYYVGIINENGDRGNNLRFVTKCDFVTKNWSYDVKSAPLAMNKVQAEDLSLALMMNGISATLVKSFTPVTSQIGHGYMHDNLVATLGLRAGYMSATNVIEIGGTVAEEDDFALFASKTVAKWEAGEVEEECYDIYIENELLKKYGPKK